MKTRYWIVFAIAGIMIIIMSAYHFMTRPGSGDTAPAFILKDVAGKEVSLEDYRGQVVLLHFWATWCSTCRYELPSIERLSKEFEGEGFAVISVLIQEGAPAKALAEIERSIPISFPVLVDDTGQIADQFEVWGVPETFVIDRSGVILRRISQAIDEEGVRLYIKDLLQAA